MGRGCCVAIHFPKLAILDCDPIRVPNVGGVLAVGQDLWLWLPELDLVLNILRIKVWPGNGERLVKAMGLSLDEAE